MVTVPTAPPQGVPVTIAPSAPSVVGDERTLSPAQYEEWAAEVRRLADERGAVVLAHNYQVPEIQDVAHHTGDSLYLSRVAAETDAREIVFCGVHFMAETAKILNPERTVVVPDMEAGCSLADGCPPDRFRAWKAKHPGAIVVSYINCSAEIKAESDWIVTSSNAEKIVAALPEGRPILFAPDKNLMGGGRSKCGDG